MEELKIKGKTCFIKKYSNGFYKGTCPSQGIEVGVYKTRKQAVNYLKRKVS